MVHMPRDARPLQCALKMHHTKVQDRKINVEPTVGGGGTGQNRKDKLKKKKQLFKVGRVYVCIYIYV